MSIPFSYADFTGGLNTYNAYDLLTDNEARDLSNVQGTTAGAIVKRGGFQTFATPGNPLQSFAVLDNGWNIAQDGTNFNLLSISSLGAVATLKTGLGSTNWEWVKAPVVSAQGPYFGMNGFDTPQRWDGVAASTSNWTNASGGVGVPSGGFCVVHQNQVFAAGKNLGSRLYWSAIADPTNWDPTSNTGAGFMDFDPNDGDIISGLGRVGPYLLVFKPRKTWVLVDAATATARRLSDTIGTAWHRSIASSPEGTYFLGLDHNVYVTNGSKVDRVSDKIQPTLAGGVGNCAGVYANAHYYLSANLSGGLPPDTTLDFDERLGSWWKHSIGVAQWGVTEVGGSQSQLLLAAHSQTAFVSKAFQPGVYQDNGSNFTWSWSGPWQSPSFYRRRRFPTPYFRKRLRQIRFDGLGQVDFSLAKDFAASPTLIGSDIFANANVSTLAKRYGQGVARAFSFVFSGTYNSPAQINSYTGYIQDRRDSQVD